MRFYRQFGCIFDLINNIKNWSELLDYIKSEGKLEHEDGLIEELNEFLETDEGKVLLNAKDEDGCALLHYAIKNGYSGVVNALIEKGADVFLQ